MTSIHAILTLLWIRTTKGRNVACDSTMTDNFLKIYCLSKYFKALRSLKPKRALSGGGEPNDRKSQEKNRKIVEKRSVCRRGFEREKRAWGPEETVEDCNLLYLSQQLTLEVFFFLIFPFSPEIHSNVRITTLTPLLTLILKLYNHYYEPWFWNRNF